MTAAYWEKFSTFAEGIAVCGDSTNVSTPAEPPGKYPRLKYPSPARYPRPSGADTLIFVFVINRSTSAEPLGEVERNDKLGWRARTTLSKNGPLTASISP